MSKLKELEEKIFGLKNRTNNTIDTLIKEVDGYNKAIDRIDLKEPYTEGNAPDNIKKLPDKKKREWIHIWNSVFAQTKSEEKAFKAANAILKESNVELNTLLDVTAKKQIMQGLLEEIDALISKANDGIKNKPGAPSIRNFLKEVKAKMKSMLKNIKESDIKQSVEKIIDSISKLEEGRGDGQGQGGNKQGDGGADKCKCPKCGNEQAHEKGIPCNEIKCSKCGTAMGGTNSSDVKESSIANKTVAKESDVIVDFISLGEANYDQATGDIDVILIEAGTNELKKRHYPVKTIQEAAPLFTGLKMYINHPTKKEEQERPERNLSDWASTIKESRAIDGKAVAKVSVHDPWLRERLSNKTFRENVGLSINAGGLISYGKVNGKDMQIVEKITLNRRNGLASVDWVTEAGARGRVASNQLFESRGRSKNMLDLSTVTLSEVLKERPDLISELKESITNELKKSKENVEKESKLKEALDKIADFEKNEKAIKNQSLVEGWLKEKKVNEVLHERIIESLKGKEFESDQALKEAFESSLTKEVGFLNKISGKGKIVLGGNGEGEEGKSLLESLTTDLNDRAGLKDPKKEGEE